MGKPSKNKWLEGLKPPDIERRLNIAANLPDKVGVEAVKRTVRAMNPAPREGTRAMRAGGLVTSRSRTI